MNSHIVNCLEPRPEPPPATARPRADTSPHAHASSGWGEAPLFIRFQDTALYLVLSNRCLSFRGVRRARPGSGLWPGPHRQVGNPVRLTDQRHRLIKNHPARPGSARLSPGSAASPDASTEPGRARSTRRLRWIRSRFHTALGAGMAARRRRYGICPMWQQRAYGESGSWRRSLVRLSRGRSSYKRDLTWTRRETFRANPRRNG